MAATATLVDSFRSARTTPNATFWTSSVGGTGAIKQEGMLSIRSSLAAAYSRVISVATYDLTGSSVFVRLISPGNITIATYESLFVVGDGVTSGNYVATLISNNSVFISSNIAFAATTVTSFTYVPGLHNWFKVTESGGTMSFWYSKNGDDWVFITSQANPWAVTALPLAIYGGNYGAEVVQTIASWDNFNTTAKVNRLNSGLRPHQFSPGIAR